jgi:hypothetical protein
VKALSDLLIVDRAFLHAVEKGLDELQVCLVIRLARVGCTRCHCYLAFVNLAADIMTFFVHEVDMVCNARDESLLLLKL